MTETSSKSRTQDLSETVRNWVMVVLSGTFLVLYGLALLGRLRPLADVSMVARLEPIIFVFIGYFFGQHNELTLKRELSRQTQKADAALHSREQMLRAREGLEAKLEGTRAALGTVETYLRKADPSLNDSGLRQSIAAVRSVLDA